MATSSSPLMSRIPIAANIANGFAQCDRPLRAAGARCRSIGPSTSRARSPTYSKARVRALTIGATDANRGAGMLSIEAVTESASTLGRQSAQGSCGALPPGTAERTGMAVSGPCLSPWPSATALVALERARNALRKAIGGTPSVAEDPNAVPPVVVAVLGLPDDETIDRLGAVASARVENYAPMAPQVVRNEATIRYAGYLRQQPSVIRSLKAGAVELDYAVVRVRAAVRELWEQGATLSVRAPSCAPRGVVVKLVALLQARAGSPAINAAVHGCDRCGDSGTSDRLRVGATARDRSRREPRPGSTLAPWQRPSSRVPGGPKRLSRRLSCPW